MPVLETFRTSQEAEWANVLQGSVPHDFFHLPRFHALEEQRGEGGAHLFVYREGGHTIALPLILRPLERLPGLGHCGKGYQDATSVYGYAGPVASPEPPVGVVHNFQAALGDRLREQRVVSVFSRLHPLLPQDGLLAGLGERHPTGRTVSIDLTLPEADQVCRYRRSHRQRLKQLRQRGLSVVPDPDAAHLDGFVDCYYQTMRRVGAAGMYFFDRAYFEGMLRDRGLNVRLFVALAEEQVVSGTLATLCGDVVQYYLGGTRDDWVKQGPMKLVVDTVRSWASAREYRVLHLGGGTGAREDSLFHFKAGFSDRKHDFFTWRWVLDPGVYQRLCAEWARSNERNGLRPLSDQYFPGYRCPTQPAAPCVPPPGDGYTSGSQVPEPTRRW